MIPKDFKLQNVTWEKEPASRPVTDSDFVELTEATTIQIQSSRKTKGGRDVHIEEFRLPAGVLTNGGSIPRPLWTVGGITPLTPRDQMAFFNHDGMFMVIAYCRMNRLKSPISFDEANQILGKSLKENKIRSWLVYEGVSLFGKAHCRTLTPDEMRSAKKIMEINGFLNR